MSALLNESELAAAAEMLTRAANQFSNHGCNDHFLPNTDENWAMVVGYHKWNGDPRDTPPRPPHARAIPFPDFMLMAYLAARMEGRA